MDHSSHMVYLVAEGVTVTIRADVTENGDVAMTGTPEVADWDGPSHVFCQTCARTIRAGEDGLADDWQML